MGSVLLARTRSQQPLPSGLPQSSRRPSRRSAWALAKFGVPVRRARPGCFAGECRSWSCESRSRGSSSASCAHRHAAGGHRVEHERHADEAVADQADAGIDHTAVAFAAEHGVRRQHHVDDVRLADRRAMERHAVLAGDVFASFGWWSNWSRSAPGVLTQHVIDTDGQRVLFADIAAVLIDDCQAVGVGILAESDLGVMLRDARQNTPARFSAVGSGGCANWPSGVPPSSVTSQPKLFQQRSAEHAARHHDSHRATTRKRRVRILVDVDDVFDQREVGGDRVVDAIRPWTALRRAALWRLARDSWRARARRMRRARRGRRHQNSFMPLYSAGLWLAEIWMPPAQRS